jgi:arsenite/tail-anchored protein-transporting ATPase
VLLVPFHQHEARLSSLSPVDWRGWETRFLFFTGKGGVGKTTVASSAALALAEGGERVLVVSTDPASNLGDVFGIAARAEPVPGVEGLFVSNLDPEEAAEAYKERVVGPYRGVLPESAVTSMEEQLSGACTVEIAAFNEFTALLTDKEVATGFDRVIFDTAPTGHTLRLLSLPGAWSGYVKENPEGASCLGPLAGLEAQRERYAAAVERLADPAETTVVLVSHPEESALAEAARAGGELAELGIANQMLVVNGVFSAEADGDPVAEALLSRQRRALEELPQSLREIEAAAVPMVAGDLTGLDALRGLAGSTGAAPDGGRSAPDPWGVDAENLHAHGVADLVDDLERAGHGVVMTMGKGGVGKTTVAAALAVSLAERGQKVVLSTTDPAAHLEGALGADRPDGLSVQRIDPEAETARYAGEVLAASGELDEEGRKLLEEDLRSPCTEEIAVFRAFARTVNEAEDAIVVLDTAPTGHTLLLLDAAQSYHREVERATGEVPPEVRALLPRLTDPGFARVLVVTLAESTPVDEAARLQDDLRRARIDPYGWIVNSSLAASGTRHPLLASRARLERPYLERVARISTRRWLLPWRVSPNGREGLAALAGAPAQAPRFA